MIQFGQKIVEGKDSVELPTGTTQIGITAPFGTVIQINKAPFGPITIGPEGVYEYSGKAITSLSIQRFVERVIVDYIYDKG